MTTPYSGLPDQAFWKRVMSGRPAEAFAPSSDPIIRIGPADPIATAGSCFAQHVSRSLQAKGYNYLVTEPAPEGSVSPQSYGVFPARFGNIYAPRQLLQLFDRAYGLFEPIDTSWTRPDGKFVDPFRPQAEPDGFDTLEALEADRHDHLAAVREMFETCAVFIFTLGLTEAWRSTRDGAVLPLAPGVVGGSPGPDYGFHNFTVGEITADLNEFLDRLLTVNPSVRVILTVSPVPLLATYSGEHVLEATIFSKSVLRVSAQELASSRPEVSYFPSYEVITGPQARGRFFADDLRSVTDEGVALAMDLFARKYMSAEPAAGMAVKTAQASPIPDLSRQLDQMAAAAEIVCDEEALDP